MIKIGISILFVLAAAGSIMAQADTAWVRFYDGPSHGDDGGNSVAVDGFGNVYVMGSSGGTVLLAYDSTGQLLWSRARSDMAPTCTAAMVMNGLGDIFITGSNSAGNYRVLTSRYNTAGDTSWTRTYEGPSERWDEARGIAADDGGNVYMTSFTSPQLNGYAFGTVKYDRDGTQLWEQLYYGVAVALPNAIALDDYGNVIVVGESNSTLTNSGINLVKYGPDGSQLWDARYDSSRLYEVSRPLALDNQGNIFVGGCSFHGWRVSHLFMAKYTPDGDTAWIRTATGPIGYGGSVQAITVDQEGYSYAIGGTTILCDMQYCDVHYLLKYFPDGDTCWTRVFRDPIIPDNYGGGAFDIAVAPDGDIYVLSRSYDAFRQGYCIIKYTSLGDLQWFTHYLGPGNNYYGTADLALDRWENIYITGMIDSDMVTIKFVQTEPQKISEDYLLPGGVTLMKAYPNPFNAQIIIAFVSNESCSATLSIYNLLGQNVATLFDCVAQAGENRIVWNASSFPSGIYFARLQAGGKAETLRMMLLK